MTVRIGIVLSCVLVVLFCSTDMVRGQGMLSLDHVDGLYGVDTLETDAPITFYIRWNNNSGANVKGMSNGFSVNSPDGATWDPITYVPNLDFSNTPPNPPTLTVYYPGWDIMFDNSLDINPYSITGSGADTVGFSGSRKYGSGTPIGFNEVVYTISTQVNDAQHGKHLCLDSTWYRPANNWLWSTDTGTIGDVFPQWSGPHCFIIRDPDFVAPSNLVISETELSFTAVQGEANPAFQSFDVATDNDLLGFSVSEGASWLSVSPPTGSTPQTVNVFVSSSSLGVGTYTETILIESSAAANSPRSVTVNLEVIPPPPEIGVSDGSFVFLAIVDGANPDPKVLTITNEGGSTLSWTVSNSESWLSLNPLSGSQSGQVTLSADITGLGYGDYFDTLAVTDPLAVNSPVQIPVTLTLGSNLPVIEAVSDFNVIIVPSGSQTVPNREVVIKNGGIGQMDFWLEENSTRILSVTPVSGTAPQAVDVGFKIIGGDDGDDFFDTLWVHSNDAVNSPFPIVFQFHYVDDPAFLSVDKDTIEFSVFRCAQGEGRSIPSTSFRVLNTGGDNPMMVGLQYESELFTLSADSNLAPAFFFIRAVNPPPTAPTGTYYDTLYVTAQYATNTPQIIIVKTNVLEDDFSPFLYIDSTDWVFDLKEGSLPPYFDPHLSNGSGGCMDWEILEDVPWLVFSRLAGSVPEGVRVGVDLSGYTIGAYVDSFTITSPTATNSPLKIHVRLNLWRLRGDVNADGIINISDVTYLVNFLFGVPTGTEPYPSMKVGDLNCSDIVNVSDIVYMVNYLFGVPLGPTPCTDP